MPFLLAWLLHGIVLAALIRGGLRVMDRTSAATRYAVYWAALAIVLALPLALMTPRVAQVAAWPAASAWLRGAVTFGSPTAPAPAPAAQTPLVATSPTQPTTATTTTNEPTPIADGGRSLDRAAPSHAIASLPAPAAAPASAPGPAPALVPAAGAAAAAAAPIREPLLRLPSVPDWLMALGIGLWLGIVSLGLLRIMLGIDAILQLKASCRPFPAARARALTGWRRARRRGRLVELCLSDEVTSASFLGLTRPVIAISPALAASLTDEELDLTVMHEFAHVQRWDDWTKLAQLLVMAVCGWHPGVRLLDRAIDLERESACDDWVVRRTGSARGYARCLVKIAQTMPQASATLVPGAYSAETPMETRVKRLLDAKRPRTAWAPLSAIATACAAAIVAVTLTQVAPIGSLIGQTAREIDSPRLDTVAASADAGAGTGASTVVGASAGGDAAATSGAASAARGAIAREQATLANGVALDSITAGGVTADGLVPAGAAASPIAVGEAGAGTGAGADASGLPGADLLRAGANAGSNLWAYASALLAARRGDPAATRQRQAAPATTPLLRAGVSLAPWTPVRRGVHTTPTPTPTPAPIAATASMPAGASEPAPAEYAARPVTSLALLQSFPAPAPPQGASFFGDSARSSATLPDAAIGRMTDGSLAPFVNADGYTRSRADLPAAAGEAGAISGANGGRNRNASSASNSSNVANGADAVNGGAYDRDSTRDRQSARLLSNARAARVAPAGERDAAPAVARGETRADAETLTADEQMNAQRLREAGRSTLGAVGGGLQTAGGAAGDGLRLAGIAAGDGAVSAGSAAGDGVAHASMAAGAGLKQAGLTTGDRLSQAGAATSRAASTAAAKTSSGLKRSGATTGRALAKVGNAFKIF